MRFALLGVFVFAACRPPPTECGVDVRAPEVSAPVGATTELTVTFSNQTSRPLAVSGLALDDAQVTFRAAPEAFTVPPGGCGSPGSVGLVLRFTPTTVGRSSTTLRFSLDGEARSLVLSGVGIGPKLAVSPVVNLGTTGLLPSRPRRLEVLNDGSIGTTLRATVESVTPASDELCVGVVTAGRCVPAGSLEVSRSGSFPLVVMPRGPGPREWTLSVVAGAERRLVRVLAEVVDTSGCALSASRERVEFGMVLAPERARSVVEFTNRGEGPCLINDATVSAPFELRTRPPVRLEPGASFALVPEVSLLRPASATGQLTVSLSHSTAAQRDVSVELRAVTSPDCLMLSPELVDFGVTGQDCRGERTVFLTNRCATPLVITGLSLTSTQFVFTRHDQLPRVLQPATSTSFTLSFNTAGVGAFSSAVRVQLDPGEAYVGLSGHVVGPRSTSDRFGFDRRPMVDTLFVIDDSPSFARQHQRVAAELDGFRQETVRRSCALDQRIAFTSTDVSVVGSAGRLRATDAGVTWAHVDQPDFAATFNALSALSASGAEHQSCLEAAARAVSQPLLSGANAGFRRPAAFLNVLCVTDDVETAQDPERWRSVLGDAGTAVSYSVIGPISAACEVDAVDDGGTHAASVSRFNGLLDDICSPWSLFGIGLSCTANRTTFYLTSTPRAGSVRVTIDGTPVPRQGASQVNWVYDAASNSVRFPDPSVLGPDPRELIIEYDLICQ